MQSVVTAANDTVWFVQCDLEKKFADYYLSEKYAKLKCSENIVFYSTGIKFNSSLNCFM